MLPYAYRKACAIAMNISAKDTLTVLELDHGETLDFTLRSGRVVSLRLVSTSAAMLEQIPHCSADYTFSAAFVVDGQPLALTRYVGSQECYYEPFVVNGLRIWLDTAAAVFDVVPVRYPRLGNLRCVPRKALRLVLQDATLRICPDTLHPWMPTPKDSFDVADCYGGDDCYLGPYRGEACHVGMDQNAELGSPLFTPLAIDDQSYFHSLAAGDENNRWNGFRHWPNGDIWCIQTHHMVSLDVPPHTPLAAGTPYGTAAGVAVGSHFHSHFEFKVGRPRVPGVALDFRSTEEPPEGVAQEALHVDPWVLFWQIFEDARARKAALHVVQTPVAPAKTGESVPFAARIDNALLPTCLWTFGDGATALGAEVRHAFAKPGVYAVTATVLDGAAGRVCATQHITISGVAESRPCPAVVVDDGEPDAPSFRPRRAGSAEVYAATPIEPHTVHFTVRPNGKGAAPRILRLVNLGGGTLPKAAVSLDCPGYETWLDVSVLGEGNDQQMRIEPLPVLPHGWDGIGRRAATVHVRIEGCEEQVFRVVEDLRVAPKAGTIIVDDYDADFYATPYFWTAGRGVDGREKSRGYGNRYFTNGRRATPGEYARFMPDLAEGRYEVCLRPETPYDEDVAFDLRIRYRDGVSVVRMTPSQSLSAGVFDFAEGRGGYVDILAENSTGLVLADAVEFRWVSPNA